jgi:dTDP-glucose pyrophosphorylase
MNKHLIDKNESVQIAIKRLDELAIDAILFVLDQDKKLVGSLTDGDVRRGLIKGFQIDSEVNQIMNGEPKKLFHNNLNILKAKEYREKNYKIVPIVNENNEIVEILNFRLTKTRLPIDVVIMAGGRGSRLLPLTEKVPKPLLKVGDKSIIERVIDGLVKYGVKNIDISINYLGHLIKKEFGDGSSKGLNIKYIEESEELGTIGALALKNSFECPYTLVLNSDILTSIDYEDYFLDFLDKKADISAVGIPYKLDIPYGIFELNEHRITKINEKPTFTYLSNGGIYLFRSEIIQQIPKGKPCLATEFIEELIQNNNTVITYALLDYWLDIGNPSDFKRAQLDIKHLKF